MVIGALGEAVSVGGILGLRVQARGRSDGAVGVVSGELSGAVGRIVRRQGARLLGVETGGRWRGGRWAGAV